MAERVSPPVSFRLGARGSISIVSPPCTRCSAAVVTTPPTLTLPRSMRLRASPHESDATVRSAPSRRRPSSVAATTKVCLSESGCTDPHARFGEHVVFLGEAEPEEPLPYGALEERGTRDGGDAASLEQRHRRLASVVEARSRKVGQHVIGALGDHRREAGGLQRFANHVALLLVARPKFEEVRGR